MIKVELVGLQHLQARLTDVPASIFSKLTDLVAKYTGYLTAGVKQNILDRFNNAASGALYQSIQSDVAVDSATVTGRAYSDGVVYAAIQEYGGTVKLPDVYPVNAKALLFNRLQISPIPALGAERMSQFSMKSKAHDVTIPEHPYARMALAQIRGDFIGGIREMVAEATR